MEYGIWMIRCFLLLVCGAVGAFPVAAPLSEEVPYRLTLAGDALVTSQGYGGFGLLTHYTQYLDHGFEWGLGLKGASVLSKPGYVLGANVGFRFMGKVTDSLDNGMSFALQYQHGLAGSVLDRPGQLTLDIGLPFAWSVGDGLWLTLVPAVVLGEQSKEEEAQQVVLWGSRYGLYGEVGALIFVGLPWLSFTARAGMLDWTNPSATFQSRFALGLVFQI